MRRLTHKLSVLLIVLAACAVTAGAAERVVFHGGHDIVVRKVEPNGAFLTLHLLEGGTILLPKSAVKERMELDREEAMKEWKAARRSQTVTSRSGADGEDDGPTMADDLSWDQRMRLLSEAEQPPVDTGTEPDVSLLRRRRARGIDSRTPSKVRGPANLAPFGTRRVNDLTLPPAARSLRRAPIREYQKSPDDGSGPHRGAGQVGWVVQEFLRNGGEAPNTKGKAIPRSAFGADKKD